MLDSIKQTARHLVDLTDNYSPEYGIILGSGLGKLADEIEIAYEFPYGDIPEFPVSTVAGHSGKLLFGSLRGKRVVCMQGRFHYYEGYSMERIAFPIRVMRFLGIETLVVSNAAGGMNPDFEIGDLMLITDHINCFPDNPLIGPNIDELGPRFPDMFDVYDKSLNEQSMDIAKDMGITMHQGVYVGVSGPCFETPSEYKYFRIIGGDAVGMSTVPEIITARHMGLKCYGVSVITDLGVEGKFHYVPHDFVQEQAEKATHILTELVSRLIGNQ
jgi:purine-nucleoside phosphorylase